MRFLLAFLFLFFHASQSPQTFPPIGVIDFYGLRTVPEASVRSLLGFHEGDPVDLYQFNDKKRESERWVAAIPGVRSASVSLICCPDDHKSMPYVGIEEPAHCVCISSRFPRAVCVLPTMWFRPAKIPMRLSRKPSKEAILLKMIRRGMR